MHFPQHFRHEFADATRNKVKKPFPLHLGPCSLSNDSSASARLAKEMILHAQRTCSLKDCLNVYCLQQEHALRHISDQKLMLMQLKNWVITIISQIQTEIGNTSRQMDP